jgi:nitroreductase
MRKGNRMSNIFLDRRSIRKYTEKDISKETVEELLRAGMNAPSAGNEQAWAFVVVRDRSVLNRLMEAHPYSGMLKYAKAAIVVCGDLSREKHPGFWSQDCAAVTENILLAATSLGLGSVWLGVYPLEERTISFSDILSLPDHILPFSLLPLGYPAEKKSPRDNFDASRIHHDRWGGK